MASEVEDGVPVHEEFFLCGGVETQIIKCGPWTNLFDKQGVSKPKHLIFVIPGKSKSQILKASGFRVTVGQIKLLPIIITATSLGVCLVFSTLYRLD